jgi:hypothetical protein
MAIRKSTPCEFGILDSKLLKIFGGINLVNLLRLSWLSSRIRHQPNQAKYN